MKKEQKTDLTPVFDRANMRVALGIIQKVEGWMPETRNINNKVLTEALWTM